MPLKRHDQLTAAPVPEVGKPETSYPTPNIADRLVIERVPIKSGKYKAIPYHSPHPGWETNGLILVWQGKVKSGNNQTIALRVYSNNLANDDWYNYAVKYSGDVDATPIFVRSYIDLREDYAALPKAAPLKTMMRLRVANQGSGYTYGTLPAVTLSGGGASTQATARAIMNPLGTKVIGLQLLTAGFGYTSNATVTIAPPSAGVTATATAEIQPADAYLVHEETVKLDSEDHQLASLFWKINRVYETLPGPWLPDTRYDNDLGPIQIYRRAVINTGQIGGTITATGKHNYQARDGSAIVLWEILEAWSNGTGTPGVFPFPGPGPAPGANPNAPYPILILDDYDRTGEGRGSYQRTSQLILATGSEEGTLTRDAGIVTKTTYEPYNDNPFLLKEIVEQWVELIIRDKRVTSEFGGGILAHNEDTAEPGTQTVETGLLVVSSQLKQTSPDEQKRITEKLDPSSAIPVLELTYGGSGMPIAPAVSFTGGTGGGAIAVSVLGFGIASVPVSAGGSGFTHPPSVGFRNGGGGGGFAVAVLGFGLASAIVTNRGLLYTSAPGVTVTGDGTGAVVSAVIGFGVYYATITDPGGRAKNTLTNDDATNVANNETVTIGGKVYTFKTTMTAIEGQVQRGASLDASLLNLIHAINHTGLPGIEYECAVANTQVFADAVVTAHSITVTARNPGTGGNLIATTETGVHLSWAATTLFGGFSYTEVPSAIFTGTGGGASANLIMGHPVTSIPITSRGTSYETPPTVAVGIGVGDGLEALAVLGFALDSIPVDTEGSGFTEATVIIDPPEPGGIQAEADAVIEGDEVDSLELTAGGTGYGTAPAIGFGGGVGTGASGTSTLGFAVATAVLDTGGTGFTSFPSVGLAGGTGSGAAVNIRVGLESVASIVDGGTGYAVDDILTIVGGTSTTAAQLRVTSVSGGGIITGVSVETVGVYSALAANPRGVTGGTGTPGPASVTLNYVSDGDANGVLSLLGTEFNTLAFSNPGTSPRNEVVEVRSADGSGVGSDLSDRTLDAETYGGAVINSWGAIDLGVDRTLVVSKYTLKNRVTDGLRAMRNCRLQGSNDAASNSIVDLAAATWDDIDIRVADTTMTAVAGSYATYTPNQGNTTAYRWLRVIQDGVNSFGDYLFFINEWEFYGDFDYIGVVPATDASFDLTWLVVQLNLTAGGTLYTSAPGVTISGGGGSGATGHLTLAPTGSVKSIALVLPGTGYTDDFTLSFTGGGGTGAAGLAHVAGVITGINITEPGSGYTVVPGVMISGDGTGAAAHAVRETSGEVWRIDVISGGVFELPIPTLVISGGGGSGAAATAILDTTLNFVHRLHVTLSGHGYNGAPTISFRYLNGTIPPFLAATATLNTTDGEVIALNVTTPGTGYTVATLVFDNAGHGGSGAAGDAVLSITGSVSAINVLTPGLYKTVPGVVISGGNGINAVAAAVLASLGQVVELQLTTTGSYSVAPTVVFTGSNTTPATGIYHLGTLEWPANPGFDTDPTYGIVIDNIKKVVETGTPYPGRNPDYSGPFIDQSPYDRWKTIQITSKVNLQTLPPDTIFPVWHSLHLPPRLLSIKALWSDRVAKMGASFSSSAHADVTSGLTGDIIIKSSEGYHGQILGYGHRHWFLGPPPINSFYKLDIIGSSGSIILTETSSRTYEDTYDDGGIKIGDSFNHVVRATDVRDHLIIPGGYEVIDATKTSMVQIAAGQSGGGRFVGITALGTQSFLTVDFAPSKPGYDIRGYTVLADVQPEQWRFNLWQATLIYVQIPYNS